MTFFERARARVPDSAENAWLRQDERYFIFTFTGGHLTQLCFDISPMESQWNEAAYADGKPMGNDDGFVTDSACFLFGQMAVLC